jgi:hypothetical protein
VVVGTYSSLFIAAPMLYYIRPKRGGRAKDEEPVAAKPAPRATARQAARSTR